VLKDNKFRSALAAAPRIIENYGKSMCPTCHSSNISMRDGKMKCWKCGAEYKVGFDVSVDNPWSRS